MGELRQRQENHRDLKLRDLARGQPCLVAEVPGANLALKEAIFHDPATTVWCHSNMPEHGKATRLKAHDCFGFLGCARCHVAIDQGRIMSNGERRRLTIEAMRATRRHLVTNMLIEGADDLDLDDDAAWLEGWRTGKIRVLT